MKIVMLEAVVDEKACRSCDTCEKVCPVYAISMVPGGGGKKGPVAKVDLELCQGCYTCEQRCPHGAITMQKRETPKTVGINIEQFNPEEISELCRRAHMNPEQILCYCTETRAEEVAAAILAGARSPVELSRMTGIRMGCSIECIQPQLRLLEAAGFTPEPAKGWQYYTGSVTVWGVPAEVAQRYGGKGFHFGEDALLLDEIAREPGGTNQ